MVKEIDVFILCGGEGKRLRKISGKIPKPMVQVGTRPFLDILIDYLRKRGFKRFILGVGYQTRFIKKYYKEHKIPGAEIIFSQEKRPLGTGGAVKNAKRLIKSDPFLVLNGDSFSEFNAEKFIEFYNRRRAASLMLLRRTKDSKEYGAITTDRRSAVTSFSEKNSYARNSFINSGVYLFTKGIFSMMPKNEKFSLEYDLFPQMVGRGLYGYKEAGFFIDIGTPERYFDAKRYFLTRNQLNLKKASK